jgi:hypothetical protein
MKRIIFLLCLISIVTIFNYGCRNIRQISKSSDILSENDSQYAVVRDSIYIYKHDSIYIRIAGDTVYKEVFRTFFGDRWHYDTIRKVDSVYIDRKIKEIQTKETNVLKWWQKMLMCLGFGFVASIGITIYKKFK